MTLRVGYVRENYGHERVVYGARAPDLAFARVARLPIHRLSRDPYRSRLAIVPSRSVDLVHLYNEVGWCARPWVASFEDVYPLGERDPRAREKALRRARAPSCRAVLAISEHAKRLLAADAVVAPALLGKCRVVAPCVPSEDDLWRRHEEFLAAHPPGEGPLRCLFVGNAFFQKGGEFVLDAVEGWSGARDPGVHLVVVSTFEHDTYVSRADAAREAAARERLARRPGATLCSRLTPRQVREEMARAHLLLFPTLNDTFGFVLAEAHATGLLGVTVASRAIPEILPPGGAAEAIEVPLDAREQWAGTRAWRTRGDAAWAALWEDARERVVEGIRRRLDATLADPARLAREAPRLRAWHEARFSPEALGARLLRAYRDALAPA